MNVTIKRVGIGSAFKVGFGLNIIVFAIFGLIGILGQLLFAGAISSAIRSSSAYSSTTSVDLSSATLPILCVVYIVGTLAAGIVGGIAAAIYALIYNLTSRIFGGIQVQLSRDPQ